MREKRFPKLAAAMLMLALVFSAALAVPAFADELAAGTRSTVSQTYMTDTAGWYTQGAESTYSTTSAVNVTVTIEDKVSSSAAIDYVQIPVTLPAVSAGKAYTVRDALMAVNNSQSVYKFLDTNGNEIRSETVYFEDGTYDTADHYFQYVKYNGTNYGPSGSSLAYDGWCFRINGKLSLESGTASSSPIGATISNAYLRDGDQVNVYFDNVYTSSGSVRFTKISSVSYDGSTMTVNAKYAYDWFTPITYAWHINDFANYGVSGITVQVSNSSGTVIQSAAVNSTGDATLSVGSLAAGDYTVRAVGATRVLLVPAKTTDQVAFTVSGV